MKSPNDSKQIAPRRTFILAALALLAASTFGHPARAGSPCVFIRNAKNSSASVSKAQVRQMYTGQMKQWNGNVVQTVIAPTGSNEMQYLASTIFATSEKDVLSRIKQEVFKGEMKRPVVARDASQAFDAVSGNPGGIAVIDAAAAKSLPAGVAVVNVTD
jgi:ABC-type phosphate transport system substrate-binding protein